jgi:hypothetical protein
MEDGEAGRDRIVRALVDALEPLDYVYALWEGGAVAFDRLDEWSDIDVCLDAEDAKVTDVFPVVEAALRGVAGIILKYDVPEASTHGYVQAFYRLAGTPPTMLIDLAVFKHSEPNKFLEPEIHGNSRFHFNKAGAVRIPALDRDALAGRMARAKERVALRFDTFSCCVEKEIGRGNWIEAMDIYYRVILGSLTQSLRMLHSPLHFDFGTRYVHYELPPEVARRLVDLHFVRDQSDLPGKVEEARRWFRETIASVDPSSIRKKPS